MVFFTCNACGESLKKAQVEKHVNMCRGCQVLSCIDCGKDFWGNDYNNHVKCISEDQKYGGKGYEAKANKGDVKQQQWIQRVHEAMNKPGVSAKLRDVLGQISTYGNVPRKKAKFQNWMKNSLRIHTSLHEEVWNIIGETNNETTQPTKESEQTPSEDKPDTNGSEVQNGQANMDKKKKLNKQERKELRRQKNGKAAKTADEAVEPQQEEEKPSKKKKKERKRKRELEVDGDEQPSGGGADNEASGKKKKIDQATETADNGEPVESEDQPMSTGKFNWKGNIRAVLRESPDQELSVKKLRKKVLAAYYSFIGDKNFKTEQEVLALFNKKIHNNPKFRVLKEKVKLIN